MTSEMETNIVSVERIKEYTDLPKEADMAIENSVPDDSWPRNGEIEIKNVTMKYREGLEPVNTIEIIGFEKCFIGGEAKGENRYCW